MTAPTLDAEPACPGMIDAPDRAPFTTAPAFRVERRSIDDIPRAIWDTVAARNPWSTPFAAWAFHRAWWDAYGANAHEETLVVLSDDGPADALPIAIVPLMHRHEVEPSDALTHTRMRSGAELELTPVEPTATAIFFGASYHADYATVLAAPDDLPRVAAALASYFASRSARTWDAIDLRRLRCGDPTAEALAGAIGALEVAEGWTLNLEREDVCPVVTLPVGADMDGYLATLGKKERHEIRRKVRRAEGVGDVRLVDSTDPLAELDVYIDLHQKRWGDDGLFPPTPGGAQSRVLFRRLFELFPIGGPLRLTFLWVGDRRIAAGIHFETADALPLLQRGRRPRRAGAVAGRRDDPRLRRTGDRERPAAIGLPPWRRAVQVRVGRGGRADPAPPRPTKGLM